MLDLHMKVQRTFRTINFLTVAKGTLKRLYNFIRTSPEVLLSTTLVPFDMLIGSGLGRESVRD